MFVQYLAIDDFRPKSTDTRSVAGGDYLSPTWDLVEQGIRTLNDDNRALVVIANQEDFLDDGGCSLGIGGGTTDGKYLCIASLNGEESWLSDPSKERGSTRDIMFGQSMDVDERYCVELAAILIAAKRFFEDGSLAPELHWIKH